MGFSSCEVHPPVNGYVAVCWVDLHEVGLASVFLGGDEAGAGAGEAVDDCFAYGAAVGDGAFV